MLPLAELVGLTSLVQREGRLDDGPNVVRLEEANEPSSTPRSGATMEE